MTKTINKGRRVADRRDDVGCRTLRAFGEGCGFLTFASVAVSFSSRVRILWRSGAGPDWYNTFTKIFATRGNFRSERRQAVRLG